MASEAMAAPPASPYSTATLESARKAKVSMENFYENLLIQDRDRTNRLDAAKRYYRRLDVPSALCNFQMEETGTEYGGDGTV